MLLNVSERFLLELKSTDGKCEVFSTVVDGECVI